MWGELGLAVASEPLEITNHALGYKIDYVLTQFTMNGQDIKFNGKAKFAKLESQSQNESIEWHKNRQKAYQGSLRHFLAELV